MPGPLLRESYNSKARQSTAGTRKKGRLRKKSKPVEEEHLDCNASIIATKSKEEKEYERREKLLRDVYLVLELCFKFH
jgi:ATP-dependent RNA helicase DHX37/DHR1